MWNAGGRGAEGILCARFTDAERRPMGGECNMMCGQRLAGSRARLEIDLGAREDLRMLLRNGTCRALGVCRHEAIRRIRAIAMGAIEQCESASLS